MTTNELDMEQVQGFAEQVGGILAGGATTAMMVVGDRLGLYRALAQHGPVTPEELAGTTDTCERYVLEWLSQQAAVGFVGYDRDTGRFTLPAAHAAVLATDDSPASLISAAPLITGMHRTVDRVEEVFRTGEGIPWGEHDGCVFDSTARFFGSAYRASLVSQWIPALDGVAARLRSGARVADVGTGHGVPLILLAEAFPGSTFVGYDVHAGSIETARKLAAEAGVSDRVRFEVDFCQGYPQDGYDVVTFFDAFHDLGDPVAAGRYARAALSDGGSVVLVEPVAGDDLATTLETVPMAAVSYAASTFLCTPNSRSQPGAMALGSQAGEARLRSVLADAGFGSVQRVAETPFHMVLQARP